MVGSSSSTIPISGPGKEYRVGEKGSWFKFEEVNSREAKEEGIISVRGLSLASQLSIYIYIYGCSLVIDGNKDAR